MYYTGSAHGGAAAVVVVTPVGVPLAHIQGGFRTDGFRYDFDLNVGVVAVPVGGILHVIDLCGAFAFAYLTAEGGVVSYWRASTADRFFKGYLFILPQLVQLQRTSGGGYFPRQIAGSKGGVSARGKIWLRRSPLLHTGAGTTADRFRFLSNESAFRRGRDVAAGTYCAGVCGHLWCIVRRLGAFHREVLFIGIGRIIFQRVVVQITRIARRCADIVHFHLLFDQIVAVG